MLRSSRATRSAGRCSDTRESIASMSRDSIAEYHHAHYHPSNVVIAAAGNLTHDEVVARVVARAPAGAGARPPREHTGLEALVGLTGERRETEQAHLVLSLRSVARDDPDRWALNVVNQLLGGGMSSRLFQEIRERRGLAYSVYSYRAAYQRTGSFSVYAGTAPDRISETRQVIRAELDRLVADGVSEPELAAAKGHLKGSTSLALETSASRMHRLGRSLLTQQEVPSVDAMVAEVEAVTVDDLRRVIDRVFATDEQVLSVVGPLHAADLLVDVAA